MENIYIANVLDIAKIGLTEGSDWAVALRKWEAQNDVTNDHEAEAEFYTWVQNRKYAVNDDGEVYEVK